tara:strand:+ start:465 stop:689 length:225 start_codon:yes stop_codon:yes gene_type:complete
MNPFFVLLDTDELVRFVQRPGSDRSVAEYWIPSSRSWEPGPDSLFKEMNPAGDSTMPSLADVLAMGLSLDEATS